MFSKDRPYRFHIELTDKCNAACPMCPRTDHLDFSRTNRDKVRKIELSLDDFQTHFTADFCRRVDRVLFGGGLGDALAASECLEICDHLTANGVPVVIATNGSLRNPAWWRRLGQVMQRTGSVVEVHIDGLRDTNPLYRVNTNFDKIMANIEAYLATGATAEWHYILFRHNEHQVVEARALSQQMGFAKFVLIDTIRFGARDSFKYQMPSGEYRLLRPSNYTSADFKARFQATAEAATNGRPSDIDRAAPGGAAVNGIHCKSQIHNSPYINAEGYVSPCCWLSGSNEELRVYESGGLDKQAFNLRNRPLADILDGEPFVTMYENVWLTGRSATCKRKCGDMIRNTRRAV